MMSFCKDEARTMSRKKMALLYFRFKGFITYGTAKEKEILSLTKESKNELKCISDSDEHIVYLS